MWCFMSFLNIQVGILCRIFKIKRQTAMKLLEEFRNRLQKTTLELQEESFNDPFNDTEPLDTNTASNDDDMFLFI